MPNRSGSFGLSSVSPRTDVTLYGLVHGILEAERDRDTSELRAGRRHPYRCTQLVAPIQENAQDGELQFRPVYCVDLSAAGLLYLTDAPPPGTALAVALGGDTPICLRAEVVREERVVHEGRPMHRIACRFVGRVAGP